MQTGYILQITVDNRYVAGSRTLVCPTVFPTAAAAWEHEQQWAKESALASYEFKHDDWTPKVMPVPVLPKPETESQDPLDSPSKRSLDQPPRPRDPWDTSISDWNLLRKAAASEKPKPKDCRTDSFDSLRNWMANRMDEQRRDKKAALQRRIDFLQRELKALD